MILDTFNLMCRLSLSYQKRMQNALVRCSKTLSIELESNPCKRKVCFSADITARNLGRGSSDTASSTSSATSPLLHTSRSLHIRILRNNFNVFFLLEHNDEWPLQSMRRFCWSMRDMCFIASYINEKVRGLL